MHIISGSKINVSRPYVVMVEFDGNPDTEDFKFKKFLRGLTKSFGSTWGYSSINQEYTGRDKHNVPVYKYRGYVFFSDEVDALSFRLKYGQKAQQVLIWPKTVTFTIYDYQQA